MEMFRREIGKNYSIIDRGGGFYENVPLGYSKATGIKMILEKLNIPESTLSHVEQDIKAAEEELDDDAESIITNEEIG